MKRIAMATPTSVAAQMLTSTGTNPPFVLLHYRIASERLEILRDSARLEAESQAENIKRSNTTRQFILALKNAVRDAKQRKERLQQQLTSVSKNNTVLESLKGTPV